MTVLLERCSIGTATKLLGAYNRSVVRLPVPLSLPPHATTSPLDRSVLLRLVL